MNAELVSHVPEDVLERFAMRQRIGPDCAAMEEHILICPVCQIRLDALMGYIQVLRAALAALRPLPPAYAHPKLIVPEIAA